MSFGRDGTFHLSYSGRRMYLQCPRMYWHTYVNKTHVEKDISASIVGSTIGVIFQWFYEKEIWKSKNPKQDLIDLVEPALRQAYHESKHEFDHNAYFVYGDQIKNLVDNGLRIIRSNRLLKDENLAETDLTAYKKHGEITLKLVGRSDFILRDSSETIILDGKATEEKDKYTDPEQLIWYALLHYMKFKFSPDKIGFLFWKFPDNPMKWVDFNEDDYRNSLRTTLNVVDNIISKKFDAAPKPGCKVCNYRNFCPEGRQYIADMNFKAGTGILKDSIFDIEKL